jgi:MFS family permease
LLTPSNSRTRTFAALAVPNYRRFFAGQSVSLTGTWTQSIAQTWLVLELGGSGTTLGLVAATQFLPVLLLGTYGGLLADRHDKRSILLFTQSVLGALALILGVLTVTHVVVLWEIFVLAASLGVTNALDNPARQSFAIELTGQRLLRNAVTLNSVMVNGARAVGPTVAALLIATVGVGICFLINAASYLAAIVAISRIDGATLHRSGHVIRSRGQLRDGLRYVRRTPELLGLLVMMVMVGTLAYEFQVSLPLVARDSLHGGASAYGLMTAAMGVGAVCGGLVMARSATTGVRIVTIAAAALGAAIALAASAPNLPAEMIALLIVGAASTGFISTGNSTLQLGAEARYRGRVMALWSVAFLGTTPVGGPVVGWIAEHAGPRVALAIGAAACAGATAVGLVVLSRIRHRSDTSGS